MCVFFMLGRPVLFCLFTYCSCIYLVVQIHSEPFFSVPPHPLLMAFSAKVSVLIVCVCACACVCARPISLSTSWFR